MAMNGGPRPGAGRPKGRKSAKTLEQIEAVKASGITPLDYLLSVMRNETKDEAIRIDAAKAAAPYVHAKLANVDMTVGNPDGSNITVPVINIGFGNGGPGEPSSSAEGT